MDVYSELRALVQLFARESIDYALCGGLAVAFHGYARFTEDIGVLVQGSDIERIANAIETLGFLDSSGEIPIVGNELHRVLKIEGTECLILDLMVVGGEFAEVWEGRELFDWEGLPIWVVSADGLATMKRKAGRDQDLLDLKKLGLDGIANEDE